jgi:hypothetical protein
MLLPVLTALPNRDREGVGASSALRTGEILLVALFSAIIIFQLFIPPSIGLASNGDFAKMIGRFSLAPASRDTSEEYKYFTARWVYNRSFQWMSDDRSSELIPITAAVLAGWWFSNHVFDIRILGAIHALLWIACFAAFLPLLRPLAGWLRYFVGAVAVFIFTDVSYIACCNSFYTDVAAFLFLGWALVLWLHLINRPQLSARLFHAFIAASVLCVLSKAQHAALGLFLCVLAVTAALSFEGIWRKAGACLAAGLILAAATVSFLMMPKQERGDDAYAGIFMIILHNSPTTLDDLRELGLGPEYLPFVDRWPFPAFDDSTAHQQWWSDFNSRTGHGQMALFMLRHPWRATALTYRALHYQAVKLRPELGNYEQQYGFPPGAETNSFGWWSGLRSSLFRLAPWHILVWYAAILATGIYFTVRPREGNTSRLSLLAALLAGMGLVELAVGSMADAGEIPRHLFLFHVITDFTILLAIVCAAWIFQGKASLRASS